MRPIGFNIFFINRHPKGFTLVEVMVALGILATLTLGITSVLTTNLNNSVIIQDRLIATSLAMEGLEIVRDIRDTKHLSGSSFDTALPAGNWRVSWDIDNFVAIGANPKLKKDNNNFYNYTNGADSKFARKITIVNVDFILGGDPYHKKILSEVSWSDHSGPRSIVVEMHLYDWQ